MVLDWQCRVTPFKIICFVFIFCRGIAIAPFHPLWHLFKWFKPGQAKDLSQIWAPSHFMALCHPMESQSASLCHPNVLMCTSSIPSWKSGQTTTLFPFGNSHSPLPYKSAERRKRRSGEGHCCCHARDTGSDYPIQVRGQLWRRPD